MDKTFFILFLDILLKIFREIMRKINNKWAHSALSNMGTM